MACSSSTFFRVSHSNNYLVLIEIQRNHCFRPQIKTRAITRTVKSKGNRHLKAQQQRGKPIFFCQPFGIGGFPRSTGPQILFLMTQTERENIYLKKQVKYTLCGYFIILIRIRGVNFNFMWKTHLRRCHFPHRCQTNYIVHVHLYYVRNQTVHHSFQNTLAYPHSSLSPTGTSASVVVLLAHSCLWCYFVT